MRKIHLKLIPGDGVGVEVIGEGKRVLKRIEEIHGGITFALDEYDWGCEYYLKRHRMMPEDGLNILSDCDCILLGAIGFPGVPDHVSLWGLLLPIRQEFDQYINFRGSTAEFLEIRELKVAVGQTLPAGDLDRGTQVVVLGATVAEVKATLRDALW